MAIVPVDIEDGDELYRRVLSYFIKSSGTVSSAAFKDKRKHPENRFSTDCAKLTTAIDCLARGKPGFLLIGFSGLART
jgi:hypothetical protein